jgi:hypothetical protein
MSERQSKRWDVIARVNGGKLTIAPPCWHRIVRPSAWEVCCSCLLGGFEHHLTRTVSQT